MFEKIISLSDILFIAFFSGLVYEILGPTIGSLSILYQSQLDKMIEMYTYRSIGYLVGSLTAGVLLRFFNLWLSLGLFMLFCSITTCLIPYCMNIFQLFCIITINGITSGILDVLMTLWIFNYFRDKSAGYINALHLCLTFGRTFLTIYTGPFINEKAHYTIGSNDNNIELSIHIPFLITSGIGFIIALSTLIIWKLYDTVLENYIKEHHKLFLLSNNMENIVSFLTLLVIALYSGMLILFHEIMVSLFANSPLNISEAYVTKIKSYSNLFEMIAKVIYNFILPLVSTFKFMTYAFSLFLVSNILLLIGFDNSLNMIWIGNILHSISTASLLPLLFSFFESFTDVTKYKVSIMIFSSGILAIIYPFIFTTLVLRKPKKLLSFFIFSNIFIIILLIQIWLLIINFSKTQSLTNETQKKIQENDTE